MCYFVPDIAVKLWPGSNGFAELWVRDGGGWAGQLFSVSSAGQHEQPDWSRWESWPVSLDGESNAILIKHSCSLTPHKYNKEALPAVRFRTRYHYMVWSHIMSTVLWHYHGAVRVVYHCIFIKKMSKNMVVLWYLWIKVPFFVSGRSVDHVNKYHGTFSASIQLYHHLILLALYFF